MYATFAFIGLFAIGSTDAVITGGADFAPHSAYAAEYRPTTVIPTAQQVSAPVAVELPAPDETLKSVEVDYSFTTETLLGGPEFELAATEVAPETLALGSIEDAKSEISKPNAGVSTDEPTL